MDSIALSIVSAESVFSKGSNSQFGRKDLTGFHSGRNFGANWDQNLSGLVIFRIAALKEINAPMG
jgi:hypothetical protein